MFSVGIDLRGRLDEPITEIEVEAREDTARRIAAGMVRAADVALGALRRFSSKELLHARTGNLARMWSSPVVDPQDPFSIRIINTAPYAVVQEEGSDPDHPVVPKNAKLLAIPLQPHALTPGGVPRFASPRDAPDDPKFFVWKSSSGNKFLAKSVGGQLELWYLLKDKVTIPATHFATAAIEDSADAALAQVKRALA